MSWVCCYLPGSYDIVAVAASASSITGRALPAVPGLSAISKTFNVIHWNFSPIFFVAGATGTLPINGAVGTVSGATGTLGGLPGVKRDGAKSIPDILVAATVEISVVVSKLSE